MLDSNPAQIAYTVRASLPDASSRDLYISWLLDEHIADVMAHGAQSGCVVELDTPSGEHQQPQFQVEARYTFASRLSLEEYFRDHAPRLRAIGLAKFGHIQGLTFERSVGVIHESGQPR